MKDVTMKKGNFIKGALITTLGIVIAKILGIVYVIPFHAIIGDEGGALYGYAYTIYTLFVSLASAGVPLAISKLVSEYQTMGYYKAKKKVFLLGREIALITDCHSMYEPTLAVLEDIRRHGIDEIYSLGDNVGVGPNPAEVFDLLEEYNVKSIAGNSEYYNTLGIEPFPYFTEQKAASQKWTEEKLGKDRIKKLRLYP